MSFVACRSGCFSGGATNRNAYAAKEGALQCLENAIRDARQNQ